MRSTTSSDARALASGIFHLKAWRAATIALLVLALIGSLLALAVPPPAVAGAQEPLPGQTNTTSFPTDCLGYAIGQAEPQSNVMAFDVTAPTQVAPDEVFTIRIAPKTMSFPDFQFSTTLQQVVEVKYLEQVNVMYELPTNASVESVQIVPGTSMGLEGTPTVSVTSTPPPFASRAVSSYDPERIVLFTPKIPKNKVPPTNETFFRYPALDVTVRATGAIGSNIATRVAGSNEATAGYVFKAASLAVATVYCWPQGNIAAPIMSNTSIVPGGGSSLPTTTALTVDPTTLPAGYQATMQATVNAPGGAVRFNDGTTVLGYAEVDSNTNKAILSAAMPNIGPRQITASYLGAPGFEASVSAPVAVNVTNPATRTPVQVTVNAGTPTVNANTARAVTVTVSPTGGQVAVPSGQLALWDNDTLVETKTLSPTGTVDFSVTLPAEGHRLRGEYIGDINYRPATGTTSLAVLGGNARPMTGSVQLNGVNVASLPAGSSLNSRFVTDGSGATPIGGTVVYPSSTINVAGGNVTGQLAQAGPSTGQIAAGSDAAASYSASYWFQVTGATINSQSATFGSGCWVGPFAAPLSGTRLGTNGVMTLTGSGFFVPPVPDGQCVGTDGTSWASAITSRFTGANTAITFNATPPAPGVAINIALASSLPSTFHRQPVTLTATLSRADGMNFTSGLPGGRVFFYSDGVEIGNSAINTTGTAQTRTSSLTTSFIPVGAHQLTARFEASVATMADSNLSNTVNYSVWPGLDPHPVELTVEAPASAQAGEVVDLTVRLNPAPNAGGHPAPLAGTVSLLDNGQFFPVSGTESGGSNRFIITSASDGVIHAQTALAPGEHSLTAVFDPEINSQWWWATSISDAVPHTVIGSPIPSSLSIVSESTRGTHKVVQGQPLYLSVKVDQGAALVPKTVNLYGFNTTGEFAGASGGAAVDANGIAVLTSLANGVPLGTHTVKVRFDPFFEWTGSTGGAHPAFNMYNQGFAPSEVEFTFEVVVPGTPGPMATGTEIQSIYPTGAAPAAPIPVDAPPAVQGTTWAQINGYVTFNAAGSVVYSARNTATNEVTVLNPAGTAVSTSALASGRGLARLANAAPTATLPAGTYEVTGTFTPTVPANFAASTSPPFLMQVVSAGSPVASSTALSVEPSGVSSPGEPLTLSATITPAGATAGTVEFFDGATSLGTAPVFGGVASKTVIGPAQGAHAFKATFTPTNAVVVTGSTSSVVNHTVAEPAVETATVLEVSPATFAFEGNDVTLTATVSPDDAVGSVVFEANHEPIGEADLIDGVATLVTDDLAIGSYELQALFEPDDPIAFSESSSNVVAYEIDPAPIGPIETGTLLAISPEGSAAIGNEVTLTATVTPSHAVGTISFLDGENVIAGPVPVSGGGAEVVVDDLALGSHSLVAAFNPTDPETYEGSASPAQGYEITLPEEGPVFACQGTDDFSVGIMTGVVAPPDGILQMPTTLDATVPAELSTGGSGPVAFTWSVTLPENLANLAIEAQAAEIFLEDMTIAMEASGGSTQTWAFPSGYTITDPTAEITLETSGTVTASSVADILYSVRSPLLITIHVPPTPLIPDTHIYVNLSCTVTNATQAITQVNEGGVTAPGAPTGVTATGGPLQANVSWTPPANDGGSEITGYVITSSPDNKVVHTSALVTSIDVIGLTQGQSYSFTVQAVNEAGTGNSSEASNSVTPSAGVNFSDVPTSNPFHAEIEWLAATGITTGTGPNTFSPGATLTRQAMAAFLYRLSGNPNGLDPACSTMPFTDVALTNAFCGEIQWMKDEGITTGNPDGSFNPAGNLSRQAMSAFLYRLANGSTPPPACTVMPFNDVATTNTFCAQITWMKDNAIALGNPDGSFNPTGNLARQAMAAFLYRYTLVIPTGL